MLHPAAVGQGAGDALFPEQRHGRFLWGRVFVQQVSLAVQGLNAAGLPLTCFPSCSWYKLARLCTTLQSWGHAGASWFVR